MAAGSYAVRCALCLLPPNCKSNEVKLKNLFGTKNASVTEQKVLYWLLESKGIKDSQCFNILKH